MGLSSSSNTAAAQYVSRLKIGADECDYQVFLSRRRTLSIMVHRDGRIVVRAPLRTSRRTIHEFLEYKSAWIAGKRTAFAMRPTLPAPVYADGATHRYLGADYRLQVARGARGRGYLEDGCIHLPCRDDDAQIIEQRLYAWYRQQAEAVFAQRLAHCWPAFAALGLRPPDMRIRRMKSRWGSMTRRRVMTLNLALIRAPVACIDYVVIHELCHLRHHNHSPAFYSMMDTILPDWRQRRQGLEGLIL